MRDEEALEARVRRLLAEPAYADHPLRDALDELAERYARQRRMVRKITRISDNAQEQLRQLTLTLRTAALTDPLTGLPNRRHMVEEIRAEANRAKRSGRPLAMLLGDLDRFKAVNDSYGHDTGDAVLAGVARVLLTNLRDYDLCGRWGGEEFLILLPDTGRDAAVAVAEKLRAAVAAQPVEHRGIRIPVSISLGIAECDPAAPIEDSLRRADAALYRAKAGGRNCCVAAIN